MKRFLSFVFMAITLISLANQQLDKPYVYSAAGPSAFDCSGFVRYCFLEAENIELPHRAQEIGYSDYPTIETIEELEIGDVVCFNTIKGSGHSSDHVGIYLGNYQFIHASSAKGKVIITDIGEEDWYTRYFSWGKRILN